MERSATDPLNPCLLKNRMLGAPLWGGRSPVFIARMKITVYHEIVTTSRLKTGNSIMNMRETLIFKTLAFKQLEEGSGHADMVDELMKQNVDMVETLTRNICAQIPKELYKEVEFYSSVLSLNKREIITLALNNFLDQARATLKEFDANPVGEA
jgi:hypothetical protein